MDDWEDALCWLLNGLGPLLAVAALFLRWPAIVIGCALVPVADVLLLAAISASSQTGFWGRRHDGPHFVPVLIAPVIALAGVSANYTAFAHPIQVKIAAAAVAVMWLAAFWFLQFGKLMHDLRDRLCGIAILLGLGWIYGFAVIALVNGMEDNAVMAIYPSRVLDIERTSKGGEKPVLAPWGPALDQPPVELDGPLKVGDRVCGNLHRGRLGLNWFVTSRCR